MKNLDIFDSDELVALAQHDLNADRLEAALAKLKQVLAFEGPIPVVALSMVARIYAQLHLWSRAKDYFEQFLQHQPAAVEETFQLGMVHYDMGQPIEAADYWRQVLAIVPTHPPALFYSALLASQSGELAEALSLLDQLEANSPADNLYHMRGKELREGLTNHMTQLNQVEHGQIGLPN